MSKAEAPVPDAREKQRAKQLFVHANDATLKNNFDYAIDLYNQALAIDPLNLLFRQALRNAERRKYNNEPGKVGMLAGARVQPVRLRARGEKGKGHWVRVLEICEEAFRIHPWDVGTSRDASEAAEQLGQKELSLWYLEVVFQQGQGDADFLRHLAHVYEWTEQFGKAIQCWERIAKLHPNDEHARRQVRALSASATIARSGLHQAVQAPDSPDGAAEAAAKLDMPGLDDLKVKTETPEQRMLREIAEDPEHVRPYLELAEHYRGLNQLDEAEKILAQGRKARPEDELLREAHADVQLARIRRKMESLEKRLQLNPDDAETQAKLRTLGEKRDAYELNELRHRVRLRPTEAVLHLDLGKALMRQGKPDEAIAEFQQARSDPDRKVEALHLSGQAFEAKGLPRLAERSYQDALKLVGPEDMPLMLALHYRLGRVAEAQGDRAAAEEHYNEVAANDYTYQDVAERLRALNQGG
jgi:tetratricopeptide (TPR) repeat protein